MATTDYNLKNMFPPVANLEPAPWMDADARRPAVVPMPFMGRYLTVSERAALASAAEAWAQEEPYVRPGPFEPVEVGPTGAVGPPGPVGPPGQTGPPVVFDFTTAAQLADVDAQRADEARLATMTLEELAEEFSLRARDFSIFAALARRLEAIVLELRMSPTVREYQEIRGIEL